jgi:glycosyltransferase involved in cell wall biosynthesis
VKTPRRVCLVTDELYPFTAGGIGRVVHNLIEDSLRRAEGLELHLLLPSGTGLEARAIEEYFASRVRVHVAPALAEWDCTHDEDGIYPPAGAFTDTFWHAQSMQLLLQLKRLAASGVRFDAIEFPDYRGWAFCTLQEKYLGRAFAGAEILVRLHSSAGIISHFEPHLPNRETVGRFELERKALLDAERVVAHIPGIAEFNQRFYGFPESWLKKVSLEFPPVAAQPAQPVVPYEGERDLLFLTKVQWFKRPDLFIRGVLTFMRQCPGYQGKAILACHAPFESYLASLKAMIPHDLRSRFVFTGPGKDREALMSRGIVVIPSDYESLNLTAYEASAVGATLVLNEACPAFAPGTPFIDGENCYTFDGTVEGLAAALERAWREPQPRTVEWKADVPCWEREPSSPGVTPAAGGRKPRVSVIITNYNLGRYLPETLASLAASSYPELEVVLVDDASTEPFDHEVLKRIEEQGATGPCPVRLVRNPVNRGLPASRNIGLRAASGDYILPLDADDCISPTFIELAVNALERHREFDVVVPSTGYFLSDEALEKRQFCDYALFIGDVPSLGLVANRISCATSLMRRSLFERFRYNERLTSYEDWDLYLRLVQAGHRFLVTNQLHFHYRRRQGSMISGVNPKRHFELVRQLHLGLPRPLPPTAHLHAFLTLVQPLMEEQPTAAPPPPPPNVEPPAPQEIPLRYDIADALNGAIKRVPALHTLLKQAARGLGEEQDRPQRYALFDLLNTSLKRLPGVHPTLQLTVKSAVRLTEQRGRR